MTGQNKNKKKNRITLNMVGLVLFVAVIAANFYVLKARAADEMLAADLSRNLAVAQAQTGVIPAPAADLEARLASVEAEYAATQEGYPVTLDRNEAINYILGVAGENGVLILPLTSEGWQTEQSGQEYNVLSMAATASGTLENVLRLIDCLQNGKYPTLAISDCQIKRLINSPGFPGNDMEVDAEIRIKIYAVMPEGASL